MEHGAPANSPPMVTPLALGVAPPSLSLAAPATDCVAGEERKKRGDCVDEACRRLALGVAVCPRWDACEASDCSWASGPSGAGLEGIWEFRVLLRGVAEARCERRCAGEDMATTTERPGWGARVGCPRPGTTEEGVGWGVVVVVVVMERGRVECFSRVRVATTTTRPQSIRDLN